MAIRPVDLQSGFAQAAQTAAVTRQTEEAPRLAQAAAQVAFSSKLEEREETVHQTNEAEGNRVNARGDQHSSPGEGDARDRQPSRDGETFDVVGLNDGEHFIDLSA